MKVNKYLVDCILNNKVHLGNSAINKDIKNFIYGVNSKNNQSVFDIFKQIGQIRKVYFLLKTLKKRKKPILFFGISQFGLDSKSKNIALDINYEIFKLSFTLYGNKKQKINSELKKFYSKVYEGRCSLNKPKDIYQIFNDLDIFLENFIKERKVEKNGLFFDSWEEGFASNYHYLKSSLDNILKENKSLNKNEDFIKQLRLLNNLSSFLDNNELPGAAVFFSKTGYEHFFQEFKKMGVPVVCILNSEESLDSVDYPLLGDNSSLNTILFYKEIFLNIFKINNHRAAEFKVDKFKNQLNS